MKKYLFIVISLMAFSCAKDPVEEQDSVAGVPDIRFVGTWTSPNVGTAHPEPPAYYTFSADSNIVRHFEYVSAFRNYRMYWRKAKNTDGFEYKFIENLGGVMPYSGPKGWTKFDLTYIDEKNIKINGKVFTK